jgi:MoaA/NifB/PqqE/SkfB family radical SAM enzyme
MISVVEKTRVMERRKEKNMDTKTLWAQRFAAGSVALSLPVLEQGLLSDRWRHRVMNRIEKAFVDKIQATTDPGRPAQVLQDKLDIARALLASFERALDRRQVSPNVLRGILRTALTSYLTELQDELSRAATEEFARRHARQRGPGFMVISPTKTCNLRCEGCYANAGPSSERLEWDVFDRIVREAKSLWGVRFFVISGGEPFAYRSQRKDLLDFCIRHNDSFFLVYTNGTLIDAKAADRMAEAANITPAISVEGFEARTERRRGPGVFRRVLQAMAHLRKAGVIYGISLTAMRDNAEELLSDEFIDLFFNEHQAAYGWLFQYMPIGRSYTLDLLVTPQQRQWMWQRTWQIIRERKILLADFWNCGTASEGCIAAGAPGGYLYIDWNGKVMPCVFVPYSAANIHEIYARGGTLDDVYELPYFRAIRHWQSEYGLGKRRPEEHGNWLLPCSLRDHYDVGRELIDRYQPEPEDDAAGEALRDEEYCKRMLLYDRDLRKVFDPIWEEQYGKRHAI